MNKGRIFLFVSLFSLILFNNFLGLFPFIFTRTSHLTITQTLALPLHLVPQGTPTPLIPFIVCIKTIRNIIRPGTLAVRLTANIIAGHLLLTLLGNNGPTITQSLL
ncbi:ATP synthase subunit a [Cryptotermes secundus]|uniref:F-ATPase protein 6 n=1 Tax=Cryptotermes secundus TaxID=105785 RepID=A0A2J7PYE0_9NEOP|nr:ATP synthase subunit a [Cryptotermes secundus]